MSTVEQVFSDVTITNYGKRIVDGVTQHRPFWKMLKSKGNIERNMGGDAFTWNLEGGRHDVHITSDDQDVSSLYTPRRRWQRPQLDWGQISAFRRFSKDTLRQNSGAQALVRVRDREIPAMFRDAIVNTNGLHYQVLRQAGSSYTGSGLPMFGLPSAFGGPAFSGVTWADTSKEGVIGTGVTYAGIVCSLSGLSGTIDGAEPDAWTPTAINTTASVWSGGTGAQTFRDNCFEILSYGISRSSRFSSGDQSLRPDCGMLSQGMFIDLSTKIQGKQTIFLSGKVGMDSEQGIGTGQYVLYHDGIPFYWDETIQDDTGWIKNFSQMGLSLLPKVQWGDLDSGFKTSGEDSDWFETDIDYNPGRRGLTVSITLNGQFWFNPRYLTLLYAGA